MKKFPSLKCPICGKVYKEVGTFGNHMRNEHPGTIPEDWSNLRYAYYVHTGKSHGRCRECGGDTAWNETTGAYTKICSSEVCRKKFRDRFMAGMRARYGKANLLDDPNFRERMLTNRKIAGTVDFFDGGKVGYMGKLEKAFVEMLNIFFRFPSSDIISPSPNRYTYYYENPNDKEHEGMHYYVPDFYIPSCNLEIELKASNNQRPRNLMIDVPKDACKDIMMIRNPTVNYVKVYEDDYYVFFQVFADLAKQNQTGETRPIKYISRSLLTSLYRDYIPDDCLRILDQYIYKYSDKSVMKKPASEAEMPSLEYKEQDNPHHEEEQEQKDLSATLYSDMDFSEEDEGEEDSSDSEPVGVNPLLYYQMGAYAPINDDVIKETPQALECFTEDYFEELNEAMEAANLEVDTGSIDGRAALRYGRWRDKLFGNRLLGKLTANTFTKVEVKDGRIFIKGINCNLLLYRIKEHYSEAKLKYIFEYQYNAKSWKLYQKKKIGRGDMKIDYVYAPEFFCLELVEMFTEMGTAYHDRSYLRIAELIYEASWLSKADQEQVPPLGTEPLSNLRLELLPHQKKFIELWPTLKNQLNLNGYILAFKPGKGKTLTAIGLAECLQAKKVYIVCPNNLKDNWALEIKKYYAQYDNESLWMRDACILGTKYGNAQTARFIITNNENIKLMMDVAKEDPDSMLIVDECHNFRNYMGGRSKELFTLADKIGSHNVLCVSATPIKAAPSELTPALRLIDPTFNDEAAAMYAKCFDLSDVMAMSIVNKRFGKVIYRPADATVELPPMTEHDLPLKVSNESKYYLDVVHNEVILDFKKRQFEWLDTVKKPRADFEEGIRKYAMVSRGTVNAYLDWVMQSSNSVRGTQGTDYHELAVKEYMSFIDTYVRPNPKTPMGEADRLQAMEHGFVTAAKRNMGKAVGSITPKRRAEMFIDIYDSNKDYFYQAIRNRTKKTVIFSTMVPVAKHIAKDLNDYGIKAVTIFGETKDRLDVLNQFRDDPNTLVLVATSWSMGVGVTLTEASQMFFFGPPWRSTDYEQAAMRIWRIGQTEAVDITTVMLKSSKPNLSDRMQQILEWSSRMFGAAITEEDLDDTPPQTTSAQEYYGMAMIYDIIFEINEKLNGYAYGMKVGNRIVDPEDKTEYDRNYRTLSPGEFGKLKGGICFDYAAYQDFFLKSHGCHGEIYFIEILEPYMTHTFSVVEDCDQLIYFESAFEKIQGIYNAPNLDVLCSFIINKMIEGHNISKPKFNVYHVKVNYGWYGESMNEYLKKVHTEGTPIKIRYMKDITNLERIDYYGAEESWGPFNDNLDDTQYKLLDDGLMDILKKVEECFSAGYSISSNFPMQNLAEPFRGRLCGIEDNGAGIATCYDMARNRILRAFDLNLDVFPFLLKMDNLPGKMGPFTALYPITVFPFYDGALWTESGFSFRRNHIYFVDNIHTLCNEVAKWCLRSLGKDTYHRMKECAPTLTLYQMQPQEMVDVFQSMTYEHLLNELQSMGGANIPFDPYTKEPFKVEVLDHGWTGSRF